MPSKQNVRPPQYFLTTTEFSQRRRYWSFIHVQGGPVRCFRCNGVFVYEITTISAYIVQEEFIKRFVQAGHRESCNDRRSTVNYRDMG